VPGASVAGRDGRFPDPYRGPVLVEEVQRRLLEGDGDRLAGDRLDAGVDAGDELRPDIEVQVVVGPEGLDDVDRRGLAALADDDRLGPDADGELLPVDERVGRGAGQYVLEAVRRRREPDALGGRLGDHLQEVHARGADEAADEPSTTEGRTGTNVAFEAPYNYRVNVNPEAGSTIEDAAGEGVSGDVRVTSSEDTISVDVPKAAIGWDSDRGVAFAAVVCPFDGFGEGGLRTIEAAADTHVIGGGNDGNWDPRVMDAVTPGDVDRAAVLSDYDAENPAVLPLVTLGPLTRADLTGEQDTGDGTETATPAAADEEDTEAGTGADGDGPGLGVATGAAGLLGGVLAARRLADRDDGA